MRDRLGFFPDEKTIDELLRLLQIESSITFILRFLFLFLCLVVRIHATCGGKIEALEGSGRLSKQFSLFEEKLWVILSFYVGTNTLEFVEALNSDALHSDKLLSTILSQLKLIYVVFNDLILLGIFIDLCLLLFIEAFFLDPDAFQKYPLLT